MPTLSAQPTKRTTRIVGVEAPAEADRLRSYVTLSPLQVHFVSSHGGAGASTLAALIDGTADAGRMWPLDPSSTKGVPVVLVARTTVPGLRALQTAMQEWASGVAPVQLLGTVLIRDIPGRAPRPILDLMKLVSSGVSNAWEIAYLPELRLGSPVSSSTDIPALRSFATQYRNSIPLHHQ